MKYDFHDGCLWFAYNQPPQPSIHDNVNFASLDTHFKKIYEFITLML